MRLSKRIILASLIIVLILSGNAFGVFGSDGKREGTVFGVSLGPGVGFMNQELGRLKSDTSMMAWQLRFRVGKGYNEQTMLTFSYRLSLYPFDNIDTIPFESDMFDSEGAFLQELFVELPAKALTNHTALTIDITRFFKPEAPTFYITGGLGLSTFPTFIVHDVSPGFGVMFGGGYEFRRHMLIEAEFLVAMCNETHGPNKIERNFGALTLSFLWLIY